MSKVRVDRKGKVALVTGAGKGLGRAASVALAEAGALVGIASRSPSDLASLEKEIRTAGGDCLVHPWDVSRVEEIRRMVNRVHEWGGKIGEPDDVTGAILYLASDSADFVTGSSVVVDGGWVAW